VKRISAFSPGASLTLEANAPVPQVSWEDPFSSTRFEADFFQQIPLFLLVEVPLRQARIGENTRQQSIGAKLVDLPSHLGVGKSRIAPLAVAAVLKNFRRERLTKTPGGNVPISFAD
jgi:hypothetical protein